MANDLAHHPELATMDRALQVLRAIITSSNTKGDGLTVVSLWAVLEAEKLYRDATGVFLNVG